MRSAAPVCNQTSPNTTSTKSKPKGSELDQQDTSVQLLVDIVSPPAVKVGNRKTFRVILLYACHWNYNFDPRYFSRAL